MSDHDLTQRFEELEAGRILGDLDEAEFREWQELSKDPRCQSDGSLELVAATIETEFLRTRDQTLSDNLLAKLHGSKADFASLADTAGPVQAVSMSANGQPMASLRLAWGIAALFAVLFIASLMVPGPSDQTIGPALANLSPRDSLSKLEKEAPDLYQSNFGGVGAYEGMSGKVSWSDKRQEGYMTLSRLPANDPHANQYQLWIVDPERDDKPVDGGVFDIPADAETIIVPIRSALAVHDPKAFVITLEQPGGVVVSKQEVVVALAGAL